MITGLLSADIGGGLFDKAMMDLQAIASAQVENITYDTPLPQVHALNCLKDILTDSRFGLRSEAHMANILDIAALSLDNKA